MEALPHAPSILKALTAAALALSCSLPSCRSQLGSAKGSAPTADAAPAAVAPIAAPPAHGGGASPQAGATTPARTISACPVAAVGRGIHPELAPSRTSGVAPLSVFFDASETKADAALLPSGRAFHDLYYCWDFGERPGTPGSGSFATTGMPKNHAFGAVAAHVYEAPGSYSARLVVMDRTRSVVAVKSVAITVADPNRVFAGERTLCFANPGSRFDGCPAGASRISTAALSRVRAELRAGRRLLLARGSTFNADAGLDVRDMGGPGLVGAFGSGAKRPVINTSIRALGTNNASDWRFLDLHIEGHADTADAATIWSRSNDVLVLRISTHRIGSGIESGTEQRQDLPNGVTIQECEQHNRRPGGPGNQEVGYFSIVAAHRLALLGNRYTEINSTASRYPLRVPWVVRGAISENVLTTGTMSVVNIHGPMENDRNVADHLRPFTEKIVFSGNVLDPAGANLDWTLAVGPSFQGADEGVRNIVIERNVILSGPRTSIGVALQSVSDVTVRNNVISNGNAGDCVVIDRGGRTRDGNPDGPPDFRPAERVSVIHNTCYGRGNEGEGLRLLRFRHGDAAATRVHNNLVVGTSRAGQRLTYDEQMGKIAAQSGNLLIGTPGFVAETPASWADFRLRAGSAAIGAADAKQSTPWDFGSRARDAAPDSGAFEFAVD